MSKTCELCGNDVIEPAQILNSHQEHGKVLCVKCHIGVNAGDIEIEPTANSVPEQVKQEIVEQEEEQVIYEPEHPELVRSTEACNSVVAIHNEYSGDIVRPAISARQAKVAWEEYLNMRRVILEPSDFQKIQGKDFIKKSGWRKFATFYNLTDQITEETRINDNGGFLWKIKVICTAPNGRQTEGVAMCASKEKSGPRIEHDVYSTAHTRAKNRAISDMIAAGEVSAEEMNI